MLRENNFRRRLESDKAVLGARSKTMTSMLVEVYGQLGFDFVWLDFEHAGKSPYDSTGFESIVRAAESVDIELLVRVPNEDPALIHKVLDTGVSSLLIPQVESAKEVQRAVKAARFSFDGEPGNRGFGGGRDAMWGADVEGFTEREDESVIVGTMIETLAAVEDIENILNVPHLGFVFIGPMDLSISMGYPAQTDHPEVTNAIEIVEDACADAGVPIGIPKHDTEGAVSLLERGYRILRVGDEVDSVREILGNRHNELRKIDT
ncbi:HpcH/HpaI aldolase family protein [Halegenticoccus tardaugens]|uniref:HpcH/HpaI aldolase family protein n=1 Tax=Halegenticoccus tardaugens TaxID=2071624 RepID=UPI00100A5420|nr:aldolase/citrate lyase family protein [Halegenticoccus tardaugens]